MVDRCWVFLCILHCCMAILRLQVAFVEAHLESLPKDNAEAACFVATQGLGVLRGRCVPLSCRLEREGRGAVRGVRGAPQGPRRTPPLGLAVLRGLKEWEHGRQCSELWGPSRPYKPTSCAHFGEVGRLGCEDAGLWLGMGVRDAREVKAQREGTSTTTTPNPPPLQA